MTNSFEASVTETNDEESVLQSLVWMAQDLGITMPPIPEVYADGLYEIVLGRVFATAPALARVQTREAISDALADHGWPPSGLAVGFVASGLGGRWFYTLVSEQQILLVSIRVSFYTAAAEASGKAAISQANERLEAHFGVEANVARALAATPSPTRRIVAYANESGLPVETRAIWTAEDGASGFRPSFEVFATEDRLTRGEEALIRI